MSIYSALDEFSASQGWNAETQLELALEYIANQQDDAAFRDFLQQYIFRDEEEEYNGN